MKLLSVVGTRPNFVKEALINKQLKEKGIEEILVHTGQHYDFNMSSAFFEIFDLPKPDFTLSISGQKSLDFMSRCISELSKVVDQTKPDLILSYGDVNTTTCSALVSSISNIPFIHIESGVRSQSLYNPEEINRRVSDHLAKLNFCATKNDYNNMVQENFSLDRIFFSGDIMWDILKYTIEKEKIKPRNDNYNVVTIHRKENADNPNNMSKIIKALIDSQIETIFPIHPRTRKNLAKYGILESLENAPNISVIDPLGYVDYIKLMANSSKIITDSGGVRREAYLLGKPCIIPIDMVWFPEIVDAGWMKVVNDDSALLLDSIINFNPVKSRPEIFGDGKAHVYIVEHINKIFG